MRSLPVASILAPLSDLCQRLSWELPADVRQALAGAAERERHPLAREILAALLENQEIAQRDCLPLCQDTGMTVVWAQLGEEVCLEGSLPEAVNQAVADACDQACLRASMLGNPLDRSSNTGNNTPAFLHLELVPGDRLTLHVAAKGGGSENMSALWMLSPSQGREGLIEAVVSRVQEAGGRPCPPLVLGVGVGGNFETAPLLAKLALFRPLGEPSPDPELSGLEAEILARVNQTGVGPLGLGGDTTALAVHALARPCHLATFPVALNVQCHAARHGTVVI
jgi:fumarate hydratase subunit alpha